MSEGNGMLPEGWLKVRLTDLVGRDGVFTDGDWVESKDQDPDGEVRLIQLADIGDGEFRDRSNRFLSRAKATELGCTFLEEGDVLVSRMADPLGRACVFPGVGRPAVTVVDACIIRPTRDIDTHWLMHAINSVQFRSSIESGASGTTRKRISRSNLGELDIPVPPAAEQRRIVTRIEELQARTRRARAALESVPALLDQLRDSVLASAFRGDLTAGWRESHRDTEPASVLLERIRLERRRQWETAELERMREKGKQPNGDHWKQKYQEPETTVASGLPELPAGWSWTTLSHLGEWTSGGTPSRSRPDFFGGDIPWVKTGELADGPVIRTEETLTSAGVEGSSAKVLPRGTLLIAMYGATIGRLGILQMPAATNQACAALLPDPFTSVDRDYVFYYLLARRRELRALGQGGAQPNISQAVLKIFPLPVAPLAEQRRIVRTLQDMLGFLARVEERMRWSERKLTDLDSSILAKAFSGELVPQASSDEPAGVMLERIRSSDRSTLSRRTQTKMPKRSRAATPSEKRPVAEVLRSSKRPLTPEELFTLCGRDTSSTEQIEEFFRELRALERDSQLEELRPDGTRVLLRLVP